MIVHVKKKKHICSHPFFMLARTKAVLFILSLIFSCSYFNCGLIVYFQLTGPNTTANSIMASFQQQQRPAASQQGQRNRLLCEQLNIITLMRS